MINWMTVFMSLLHQEASARSAQTPWRRWTLPWRNHLTWSVQCLNLPPSWLLQKTMKVQSHMVEKQVVHPIKLWKAESLLMHSLIFLSSSIGTLYAVRKKGLYWCSFWMYFLFCIHHSAAALHAAMSVLFMLRCNTCAVLWNAFFKTYKNSV